VRIDEAVVANTSPDKGTALSALRYWNEWNNERELHGGHDGLPEDDPAVEELLRTFWDNAESGWAKSKGFTTGGKGDPSSKAWSAAFISAAEDDPNFEDSQRHKDYMTDAEANRKKFDKGDDVRDLFVAFDPGEINPGPGDKRCHPRLGGKHCDICMDVGCTDIIGGNVGDDLTRRSASDAPAATMYITKGPARIEIEKGDAITEITHKHLRDMIQEEMSFISDGKKASKTKGRPYKGSRRGKTESQAQQMSAGIALGSRRKYGKKGAIKKLKGAPKSMATMSMKDLKKLATIRRGSEVPDKTKKGHERAALPGHIDESIKVRGIPVNWDKTIDGDPAISFGSNLYTVTGPMGVSIDIKNIEYSSDPESAELVASADLPWPAQDKIITDMLKPKNIDAIVSGVNSGGDFEIVGRHGAVKFNRVKG